MALQQCYDYFHGMKLSDHLLAHSGVGNSGSGRSKTCDFSWEFRSFNANLDADSTLNYAEKPDKSTKVDADLGRG